jgi:hypothetical protein
VIIVSVNLSPQQSTLFFTLTFSTMFGPPLKDAFHHIPTPYLVIAVLDPPLFKAQSAPYELPEYGLFIDGFSSSISIDGPEGIPVVDPEDVDVVDSVDDSAPVNTSIP